MKYSRLFALFSFFIGISPTLSSQERDAYVPNEVIVCVRSLPQFSSSQVGVQQFNQLSTNVSSLLNRMGVQSARPLYGLEHAQPVRTTFAFQTNDPLRYLDILDQQNRTMVVTLQPGQSVESVIAQFKFDPDVEFVEPNYYYQTSATPNDTLYSTQWGLANTGQTGGVDSFDPTGAGSVGSDIDAEAAWDTQTGSTNTVVAVIDTGLDWDHPDIVGNVWTNASESSGSGGADDDSNGFIDDVRGWDFGSSDADPDDTCFNSNPALDAGGHGTHVSGIVGARGNNSTGVSGVNWRVSIMPLKVANESCGITTDGLANAITYAANNGAHIINMSLGGPSATAVETAINAADTAGVVMIAAAGNENTSITDASFPAAYSNVVGVAATDRTDVRASFSNFGDWISVSGPGVAIRSLLPVPDGSYGYLSGTSMASPMVAGVAALIKSQDTSQTDSEIIARLENSAESIDSLNPSFSDSLGTGRVNAVRALMTISSVFPTLGFNLGSVDVTVTGTSIPEGAGIRLSNGSESVDATNTNRVSSTTLTGTLTLTGLSTGDYDLSLVIGQTLQTLANGFEVKTITITNVTPSTAPINTTAAVTITGTEFTSDLIISLNRTDPAGTELQIDAAAQSIVSSNTATATFNLSSHTIGGRWDLRMSKLGTYAALQDGFGIITDQFKVVTIDDSAGGTFTVDSAAGNQTVTWPAGAVGQNVVLDIDSRPTIRLANKSLGSVDPYSATDLAIEIVSNPSNVTFASPFTLTIPYRLEDLDDPTKESALTIAVYNTTTQRWERIPSTIDTNARTVSALISHLSLFSIIQHEAQSSLNRTVAFPNPYRSDRHSNAVVNFDFLTAGAQVRIFDVTGELVRDLTDDNQDGLIIWSLDTDSGEKVASGMYIYLITDPSGNKITGRVGVIR